MPAPPESAGKAAASSGASATPVRRSPRTKPPAAPPTATATRRPSAKPKPNALRFCRQYGGSNCMVRVWGCDTAEPEREPEPEAEDPPQPAANANAGNRRGGMEQVGEATAHSPEWACNRARDGTEGYALSTEYVVTHDSGCSCSREVKPDWDESAPGWVCKVRVLYDRRGAVKDRELRVATGTGRSREVRLPVCGQPQPLDGVGLEAKLQVQLGGGTAGFRLLLPSGGLRTISWGSAGVVLRAYCQVLPMNRPLTETAAKGSRELAANQGGFRIMQTIDPLWSWTLRAQRTLPLLAIIALAVPPLSAQAVDEAPYGAVAAGQKAGGGQASGIAFSPDGQSAAEAEAVAECRQQGGRDCTAVGWFRASCGALAAGGGRFGVGWGDTEQAAQSDALSECGIFNDGCRSLVAKCDEPDDPEGDTRNVGEVFRDCPGCPEMVVVPAGEFVMGSPPDEEDRDNDEGPQHPVRFASPFAVGVYEVTFDEWDACVSGGGCGHRPGDEGWGRGTRPVIKVSWNDAREYVGWLSGRTGHEYRLLSEVEWEYAARAGTTTPYHFGWTLSGNQANFYDSGGHGGTVPVGRYPANAIRFARHARQRVGVGGGLLERRLRRCARQWRSLVGRRLFRARFARRLLGRLSGEPPFREPRRGRPRRPARLRRLPCGPDAHPMTPYFLTSSGRSWVSWDGCCLLDFAGGFQGGLAPLGKLPAQQTLEELS